MKSMASSIDKGYDKNASFLICALQTELCYSILSTMPFWYAFKSMCGQSKKSPIIEEFILVLHRLLKFSHRSFYF